MIIKRLPETFKDIYSLERAKAFYPNLIKKPFELFNYINQTEEDYKIHSKFTKKPNRDLESILNKFTNLVNDLNLDKKLEDALFLNYKNYIKLFKGFMEYRVKIIEFSDKILNIKEK